MAKVSLDALRQLSYTKTPGEQTPEYAMICPHGPSGSGKTTLWGQFGLHVLHDAFLIQGEKGNRDLDNPNIQTLDVNAMFNIGDMGDLKDTEDGLEGEIENLENAALGWDYVRAITEDLIRTGGRNINKSGKPFRHVIWDSGTTFQKMCLSWVIKNNPNRKRPGSAEGTVRPSLEDYGEAVLEFDDWLIKCRDLKRRMNVVIIFLTMEHKYTDIGPDGFSMVELTKFVPMVFGKKLPTQIISYADFAPYHQQVDQNVMLPDPTGAAGKGKVQVIQQRGIRFQPTSRIYAKGRGKLNDSYPLLHDKSVLKEGQPAVGWRCHELNLKRICQLGNIPL